MSLKGNFWQTIGFLFLFKFSMHTFDGRFIWYKFNVIVLNICYWAWNTKQTYCNVYHKILNNLLACPLSSFTNDRSHSGLNLVLSPYFTRTSCINLNPKQSTKDCDPSVKYTISPYFILSSKNSLFGFLVRSNIGRFPTIGHGIGPGIFTLPFK